MPFDDIDDYLTRYTDRDEPAEEPCSGCGLADCECDLTHPDDLIDEAAGAGAWCECGAPLPCPDCFKGGDDR